jgi:xanthine dehydrogenase YagT iron-sulfur-binding subunit
MPPGRSIQPAQAAAGEALTQSSDHNMTRRHFLAASSALLATTQVSGEAGAGQPQASGTRAATSVRAHDERVAQSTVSFDVNSQRVSLDIDNRTTLLDALREHLGLTGTKKGCDHGQCGACTVIVDGRRINACLTLAIMHEGSKVTTVEGLGTPGHLHPMQAAFIKHDGYQCGYCTPGQICSAVAVLEEVRRGMPSHVTQDLTAVPVLTADELRERMSGNICRCGAYSNIVEAITEVAGSTT